MLVADMATKQVAMALAVTASRVAVVLKPEVITVVALLPVATQLVSKVVATPAAATLANTKNASSIVVARSHTANCTHDLRFKINSHPIYFVNHPTHHSPPFHFLCNVSRIY